MLKRNEIIQFNTLASLVNYQIFYLPRLQNFEFVIRRHGESGAYNLSLLHNFPFEGFPLNLAHISINSFSLGLLRR